MSVQPKSVLETYFITGAAPTQGNFTDLIDSLQYVLDKTSEQEIMDHTDDTKFTTPLSLKKHTVVTKLTLYSNFS